MTDKEKGFLGEEIAAEFLQSKGLEILERNYVTRGGELDIIAKDGETLVFVEVKTRLGTDFPGAEAMDEKKISFMLRCAERYVLDKKDLASDMKSRFDFVEICFEDGRFNGKPKIIHSTNIIF
ncbi:MAG: YraN family protein [Clostridia bacterium]|nr:YraN family protein [Clostridia bacterium]